MDQSRHSERIRECYNCHFRGVQDQFRKCSSCDAVLYCCEECQRADWDKPDHMKKYSHKYWCQKMKHYMDTLEELKLLPFDFTQETTSSKFDGWKMKEFLGRQGIYNEGLWRRECTLWIKPGTVCLFGTLSNVDDPYVLPVESSILEDKPTVSLDVNIKDWKSYYIFRGFRMDSPICILLQWPLTLYYIVTKCLPDDYSGLWNPIDRNKICIDIVGVEKEVEMLETFQEFGKLLPDKHIDIHMFGREIWKGIDGCHRDMENIKITIHRKWYHKVTNHRKPDVIVGFNAGLAAYTSWLDTIKTIREEKTPAYFTDYCQHSTELAKIGLKEHCLLDISEPVINPFRSPVIKLCEEHDMPWFSNAFIFHLLY